MDDIAKAGWTVNTSRALLKLSHLPAPNVVSDGPNKVMDAADTAVGARERKRKVPPPTGG
jgi:hypothetical protein